MPESPTPQSSDATGSVVLPFVAPCRQLPAGAPLQWIRKGWADLRKAPRQSLGYGAAIVLLSWLVTGVGLKLGSYWAVLVLLSAAFAPRTPPPRM